MRCEPNPTGSSAALPIEGLAVSEPSSLDLFLEPLRPLLSDQEVTEICINRPGEAYVERHAGWSHERLAFATYEWGVSLAKLVANYTKQRVNASEPLLSATLPGGARV